MTSEQIVDLASAMSKAQSEMRPAIKDAVNPAFRSKYADLTAVWDAARDPLTRNGLSVWQDVTLGDRGVSVVTRVVHTSGQWVEFGPLTVPIDKPTAQGVGSATSYAKRYAMSAAIGIVAEQDDDGHEASARPKAPPPREIEAPKPTVAPVAPAGFEDWYSDLSATADAGSEALHAAWKASPKELKAYMTSTKKAAWDAMKARASKVQTQVPS